MSEPNPSWQPAPQQPYPQDPTAQQRYPQDPAPQQQPGGVINFTVQGSVMTNSMVSPSLLINGHRVPVSGSGVSRIPAPVGRHHLQASQQWMRTYGQAELTVDIAPGQQVDVFYAAPYHQFATGDMGVTPQKKKGLGLFVGLLVGVVAVIILAVVLGVVLG